MVGIKKVETLGVNDLSRSTFVGNTDIFHSRFYKYWHLSFRHCISLFRRIWLNASVLKGNYTLLIIK